MVANGAGSNAASMKNGTEQAVDDQRAAAAQLKVLVIVQTLTMIRNRAARSA